MKYLVNTRTKEHIRYNDDKMSPVGIWKVVEADADGWIPWNGGECPLPDDAECVIETPVSKREMPKRKAEHWCWSHDAVSPDHRIVSYRPILAEKEEPRRHGRTIVHIPESPQSVFDRLKSAIAASESIPGIIAEIDALLPDGYCVAKVAK